MEQIAISSNPDDGVVVISSEVGSPGCSLRRKGSYIAILGFKGLFFRVYLVMERNFVRIYMFVGPL